MLRNKYESCLGRLEEISKEGAELRQKLMEKNQELSRVKQNLRDVRLSIEEERKQFKQQQLMKSFERNKKL